MQEFFPVGEPGNIYYSMFFVMCEVYLPVGKHVKFQCGSWLQADGRKFAPCGRFFNGLGSEEKPMITLVRRVGVPVVNQQSHVRTVRLVFSGSVARRKTTITCSRYAVVFF